MSQPVTWDQIIDAAADNDGTVGVQANKYEGYVVWINALIPGAGGDIVSDTEKGVDASIDIDSQAGDQAARSSSSWPTRRPTADLSVSNEGTVLATLGLGKAGSWSTGPSPTRTTTRRPGRAQGPRLGPLSQTVEGEHSRPPIGGIGIGVERVLQHSRPRGRRRPVHHLSPDNQVPTPSMTGNMPASPAAYDNPELRELFPADLLKLCQREHRRRGPRPAPRTGATSPARCRARGTRPPR